MITIKSIAIKNIEASIKLFRAKINTEIDSNQTKIQVLAGTLISSRSIPNNDFEEFDLQNLKIVKKGILEFDLEDHYIAESFDNATNADHMKMKIDTYYDEVLRRLRKYDDFNGQPLTEDQSELLEYIIEGLYKHFEE